MGRRLLARGSFYSRINLTIRYMQPFVNTGRTIPTGSIGGLSFIKKASSILRRSAALARAGWHSSCLELGRALLPSLGGTASVHMKLDTLSQRGRTTWLSFEANGSLTEPQMIDSTWLKRRTIPASVTCCGLNDCAADQCDGKTYLRAYRP